MTIDLRITRLDKQVEEEVEKAKQFLVKNDRNKALQCMKRKKMYEGQVEQLASQRANLENMKFTLENAALNRELVDAQRRGANELSGINAGMDAGKIDDHMAEIQETMDAAKQIGEMLAQPMCEVHDDYALLDELHGMMLSEGDQAVAVSTTTTKTTTGNTTVTATTTETTNITLPSVPTTSLPTTTNTNQPIKSKPQYTDDEEEMLRQLQNA